MSRAAQWSSSGLALQLHLHLLHLLLQLAPAVSYASDVAGGFSWAFSMAVPYGTDLLKNPSWKKEGRPTLTDGLRTLIGGCKKHFYATGSINGDFSKILWNFDLSHALDCIQAERLGPRLQKPRDTDLVEHIDEKSQKQQTSQDGQDDDPEGN